MPSFSFSGFLFYFSHISPTQKGSLSLSATDKERRFSLSLRQRERCPSQSNLSIGFINPSVHGEVLNINFCKLLETGKIISYCKRLQKMVAMKSYSLGLLLVFFVVLVYAELLPRCSGGRTLTSQDAAEGKQPVLGPEVGTSRDKGESINNWRSHGVYHLGNDQGTEKAMSQMLGARGGSGHDTLYRPKGKKNGAEASLTKSTSVVLMQVTLAAVALVFLD